MVTINIESNIESFSVIFPFLFSFLGLIGFGFRFKKGVYLGDPWGIGFFKFIFKKMFWIPNPFNMDTRHFYQPRFDPLGGMSVKMAALFNVKDDRHDVYFVRGIWFVVFIVSLGSIVLTFLLHN